MLASEIPIGRIARLLRTSPDRRELETPNFIFLFRTYSGLFKTWPTNEKATIEKCYPPNDEWEVELLPETTTITFKFDGVSWSRPNGYSSPYDNK